LAFNPRNLREKLRKAILVTGSKNSLGANLDIAEKQ